MNRTDIFFAALPLLLLAACQQEAATTADPAAPPDAVVQAFRAKHGASAEPTGWEMEDDNVEMDHMENGAEVSELYDTDGDLISTERHIDPATLPQAVREAIAVDAPDHAIEGAETIVSEIETQYEVELKGPDGVRVVIYSEEGMAVGEETEEGTEEQGDSGSVDD